MERDSTPGSVSSEPSQGRWVLEKNENPATEGIGSLPFFLKHTTSAKGGRHGSSLIVESKSNCTSNFVKSLFARDQADRRGNNNFVVKCGESGPRHYSRGRIPT